MDTALTRRQLLRAGAGGGAAMALSSVIPPWVQEAMAAPAPKCGRLKDIHHIVILIQENRSFDHYFGTYRGVRGYSDPNVLPLNDGSGMNIFAQPGYDVPGYNGHLLPFHLDTEPPSNGECTNDITHAWGAQHRAWNNGAMDRFLIEHLQANGPDNGPLTQGFYRRSDLEYYYALADAFTI